MPIANLRHKLDVGLFTLSRVAISTSYRMVYPFLPVFANGLGVEATSLAMALSIRSLLGVLGPFLATVADTHDRKTGILLGLGLFTIGSGMVGIWPVFWSFILGTSLVVLGNGVFIPSVNAYLGDRVAYEKRGRIIAILELNWALSFILGIPVVRYLLENYHWAASFVLLGAIGGLFLVIFAWKIPAHRIKKSDDNNIWGNFRRIVRSWPAIAGLLVGIISAVANESVNLVFGLWIERLFGLNFAALTAASIVIGISELGGEVYTGVFLDATGKRKMIWVFLGVNSLSAVLLPLVSASLGWTMAGLALFYFSFEILMISTLTLMSEVLPSARATMLAASVASFSLGRMFASLIAPGLFEISFWAIVLTTVVLNLVAAVFLIQVRVGTNSFR